MNCIKCDCPLQSNEVRAGKGKCISCLIEGYKWALMKQSNETKKAMVQVELLRRKVDNANLIVKGKNRIIDRLQTRLEYYEE